MKAKVAALTALEPVSNDGADQIKFEEPYVVGVTFEGVCPLLFHRWSVESIEEKSKLAKGSKGKKQDDVQSFVYRNEKSEICIPGEYFRQAIVNAARFLQDPRSPRKSMLDLFKAGLVSNTELCTLGKREWDYTDKRRVTVQRQGLTRHRPAFNAGWEAHGVFAVVLPEYIPAQLLHETMVRAGRLVGVGDFRPSYGRFSVTHFAVQKLE